MTRVIFINGPPYSGKDTSARVIEHAFRSGFARIVHFADELKDRTHALYGMPDIPTNYFEHRKDIPAEEFLGLTPRQAYIYVSETYMKVQHGRDIWGRLLLRKMEFMYPTKLFLVADSGFVEEAHVLVDNYDPEKCLLLRLHRTGHGFANDSRGYIDLSHLDVPAMDLSCDNLESLRANVLHWLCTTDLKVHMEQRCA